MSANELHKAMAARDIEQLTKAAEEYASRYPAGQIRIEIEMAFIKGAGFGTALRHESAIETIRDTFRNFKP